MEVLASLFRTLSLCGEPGLLDEVLDGCLADEGRYGLREVLVPATRALHGKGFHQGEGAAAWRRLRAHCLEGLGALTARPVAIPDRWSIPSEIACPCAECRVHRFRAVQHRRTHLEDQCRRLGLDLDLHTERSGSPHTLVLTKNRASFVKAQRQFDEDCRTREELEPLVS